MLAGMKSSNLQWAGRPLSATLALLISLVSIHASYVMRPVLSGRALAAASSAPTVSPAQIEVGADDSAPEPTDGTSRWLIELRGRYVRFPDFVVAALFDVRTTMDSYAVGAAGRYRLASGDEVRFSLDYLRLGFRDGNWLESTLPPLSTVRLEWDLGMLTAGAAYVWRWRLLSDSLAVELGAGLGLGVLLGNVASTDVVPVCESPASQCVAWRWAGRRDLSLPTRVLPVPAGHAGVEWRPIRRFVLRFEAGLFGLPYVGLSAGAALD